MGSEFDPTGLGSCWTAVFVLGGGLRARVDRVTEAVIGAAIEVHRVLGPGLLESVYEACLARELEAVGLSVERQVPVPVVYKDVHIECGFRVDLLVEDLVVLELKALEHLAPVHNAQLLSYLRLSHHKVGLLINFHVKQLTTGIRRVVNDLDDN